MRADRCVHAAGHVEPVGRDAHRQQVGPGALGHAQDPVAAAHKSLDRSIGQHLERLALLVDVGDHPDVVVELQGHGARRCRVQERHLGPETDRRRRAQLPELVRERALGQEPDGDLSVVVGERAPQQLEQDARAARPGGLVGDDEQARHWTVSCADRPARARATASTTATAAEAAVKRGATYASCAAATWTRT